MEKMKFNLGEILSVVKNETKLKKLIRAKLSEKYGERFIFDALVDNVTLKITDYLEMTEEERPNWARIVAVWIRPPTDARVDSVCYEQEVLV